MIDIFESEGIVDRMCARADSILKEIMAEFHISHVVAGFSGGDDSMVSTHWALNRFSDSIAMIGDTEIGLPESREHQDAVCSRRGWEFERVSPCPEGPPRNWKAGKNPDWVDGETSYEEFVFNFGFPGNGQHARMYQRLKQRAFRKIKPILGKRPKKSRILVVSGIRHDESAIRAGYKRAYQEEPSECFVWFNPFYYSTAVDFEIYRQEFGLTRNPMKARVGISGECECGAHAVPGERELVRRASPRFDEYLTGVEAKVDSLGFPWGWDEKPPKWWSDAKRGQLFLFDPAKPKFMPACVGCNRKGKL